MVWLSFLLDSSRRVIVTCMCLTWSTKDPASGIWRWLKKSCQTLWNIFLRLNQAKQRQKTRTFGIQQTLESTRRNQATPLLSQVKRLLRTAPHHLASSIGIDQSGPSLLFPNYNSSFGSRYKGLYQHEIISKKEECCRTLHVSTVTCSKQQNTSFSTAPLLNGFGTWFPLPPISNQICA